jgi:hypothetical protein
VTFSRAEPLRVHAEVTGEAPTLWAWAIYRGTDRFLIARSRPEYQERNEALEAGLRAAVDVGRRLRVEVVTEDADCTQCVPV